MAFARLPQGSGARSALVLVESFGIAVRRLRESRGWSQERLAEVAELNRSYVGEIERGTVVVSLLTQDKLAMALGISLAELAGHAEQVRQSWLVRGLQLSSIAY